MMWVTFHSTLRRLFSVGAVFITCFETKDDYSFIGKMGRKSKEMAHALKADEKFVIPNLSHHFIPTHPTHSWFWSGSDWIDAKSALQQICCINLDFLWRVMNFIRAVASPSGIFLFMVSDAIGKKSLEYMDVQILDSFSARMRQQIPPNRRNSCFACCTCMKVITCGTCMKA